MSASVHSRSRALLAIFLCLLLGSSCLSAAEKDYSPLLDRARALELAHSATPAKYPDADEVLAAESTKVSYRPDGTYTQLEEVYLKVLTEKGKQDNRTIASHFTIPYQLEEDCKILLVEIIKPDNRTIPVDLAKNAKLVVDSADMGANIYNPNDKIIQVNIPGLEIGDTLHYYMYDNIRQPRAAGIYADIMMFESTNPILYREARIDGPENLPLDKIAVRNPHTGPGAVNADKPEKKDGRIYYRWQAQDIPQAFPEPNTPPLYSCLQRLMVSTAPDWPTVSRWYWSLCEKPLAATTPEMEKQVKELTAGLNNPADKIKRIFYWVSQNIRYLGITTESVAPGYEPHPVKETFNNRHGVCRDKAALLAAMLRLAGIESYPVIINNGEKKDPEIAQPWFNHAITAAKIGNDYVLMDSTDENTKELLPSYLDNRSYLVATPQGEKLRTSPVIPAEQNLLRIETTGSLDARGNLRATSVLNFDGINDNVYRGYFARLTPEERRRHFESKIKDIYGEARLNECKIDPENLLDTSRPLRVKLDFAAENISASGGSLSLLPLPFLGTRMGMVNFVIGQTGLDKRRFPLYTEIACGVEESVRLTLPDNLEKIVSLPVYKTVENDELVWKRSLSKLDKSLMGKSSFLLKGVEFSPAQYLELKEALRQIEYSQRKMPLMAAAAPAAALASPAARQYADADAVILDEETSYIVLEPGKWIETRKMKKKVLTYSGQKDNAEIKIDFNPAWETVTVTDATVTAPDGKMLSISAKEINIMDQPWNGRAARYPGGKTLVASLPGVALGSVLEYTVRREVNGRPFFSFAERFRSFDPVAHKSLIVTLPKKLADGMNYKVINASTASGLFAPSSDPTDGAILDSGKTEVRDTVVWRWSADSAEGVKRETTLPPWGSFTPMVYASTGNWPAFAALLRQKLNEAATNQPAAAAKAKELTAGMTGARQRIIALRNFVAKEIRRAGPDIGELPLSCLTPADRTLSDQYGNSADRAILLHAMLSSLGFKPEFYLTTPYESAHNLHLPQLELANSGVLDEVLVRVNATIGTAPAGTTAASADDEIIWLNDTDQYAEPGTAAAAGNLALDTATGKFRVITTREECADNQEVLYLVTLSPDGAAVIKKTITLYGIQYARMKKNFAEMTPEQRSRYQQEVLAELSQAARPVGEFTASFDQYPGKIEFTAEIARFAVRDGQYLYLQLPQTLRRIFGLTADTRANPLYLSARGELRINTILSLPPEFAAPLISPKDFKWRSPAGDTATEVSSLLITPLFLRSGALGGPQGQARAEILRELSNGRNILFFSHLAQQSPAVIAPALYPELLEAQNTLSGNQARTILFQMQTPEK